MRNHVFVYIRYMDEVLLLRIMMAGMQVAANVKGGNRLWKWVGVSEVTMGRKLWKLAVKCLT